MPYSMLIDGDVDDMVLRAVPALKFIETLSDDGRVHALNLIREYLHSVSPFATEPVDFVKWVPNVEVHANSYNPNSVAPPEMELLRVSIMSDGYTQPIVSNYETDHYEVVDGFHRNRVGKECADVRERVHGYLPVVQIRAEQVDITDRMASTIRHNRARGKHRVEAMSEIVIELKRRNWSDDKIAKNLGMEPDEILRLCQISGLSEIFKDQDFSSAWDVEGEVTEADFIELSGAPADYLEEVGEVRTVNTNDPARIFHTFDKWECHKAGFYQLTKDGLSKTECERQYAFFLADLDAFRDALEHVISEWKHSCEHYLTNGSMNRIAWLGQAAMCYATGVPSVFRGGYYQLTEPQRDAANALALEYLNKWLVANDREPTTQEIAMPDRQVDIY